MTALRTAFVALLICFLAACASVANFMPARDSTVRVETDGGLGSGVVVNEHCVVTAYHVVEGEKQIAIVGLNQPALPAMMFVADTENDIAVICTGLTITAEPVVFRNAPLDLYETVFTIGMPLGGHWILTEGRWQGFGIITAASAPGNSGGGVFDAHGDYVGFVDAIAAKQFMPGTMPALFPHLVDIKEAVDIRVVLDAAGIKYTVRN